MRPRVARITQLGIVLCVLCLLSGAFAQADVRISLGDATGAVEPLALSGFNYGNMMRVVGYEDDFAALNLRALRFPPGNQADEIALSPAVIDAFRMQWALLGEPDVMVVANLFQGSVEEAASAARYFREVGIPVVAWAVGNEPDLYATNRGDPSWTPEVYCERFRSYAAALKAVDPGYKITGPAVSGSRPSGQDFLREVVRRCGDVIDMLTWHVYPTDGTWSDDAALATSEQVGDEIALYRQWLQDPTMNPLGYERATELGITEFGLSWKTSNYRHLEDMTAALWLADALGQMAATGLDESYYFALQGLGGHGLIDNAGWVRPTYFVYEMLATFRGRTLAVEVNSVASNIAGLSVYALESDDGVRVLLVNQSEEDVRVTIEPFSSPSLNLATLSDPIFDELLAYASDSQSANDPVFVPARSVVVVTPLE